MDLRKTFFILPNLFTLSNVFCGFFALSLCSGEAGDKELYQAALAICFGFFFDTFDGRVARLTKTQSNLGMQLDSLADMVTFGAAPAMLVYKWGLTSFGLGGVFIAFLFVAAGALRLARFNVLTAREDKAKPGKYMVGMPIPAAAAVLVSLVVVHFKVGGHEVYSQGGIALLVAILSYLMISRVHFRSFKDLRVTRRTLAVLFLIILACVIIVMRLHASFIFIFMTSAYLTLGLTEELVLHLRDQRRRRRQAKLAAGQPVAPEDEDEMDDEEEVIKELIGDPPEDDQDDEVQQGEGDGEDQSAEKDEGKE